DIVARQPDRSSGVVAAIADGIDSGIEHNIELALRHAKALYRHSILVELMMEGSTGKDGWRTMLPLEGAVVVEQHLLEAATLLWEMKMSGRVFMNVRQFDVEAETILLDITKS